MSGACTTEVAPHWDSVGHVAKEVVGRLNLDAVIRSCRMMVCDAYFTGGHPAALAAIAAASIRLFRYVFDGSLIPAVTHDTLQEVAENLTLVRVLGQDAVDTAINAGPRFYEDLAVAS